MDVSHARSIKEQEEVGCYPAPLCTTIHRAASREEVIRGEREKSKPGRC